MPVPTIGNISLPESSSVPLSDHQHRETLKGGVGNRAPGNLIEEWPIPEESQTESPLEQIRSVIKEQFEVRPWLVLAVAIGLGTAIGRAFVRR